MKSRSNFFSRLAVKFAFLAILCFALTTCANDDAVSIRKELNIWVMPNFPDPHKSMEKLLKGFKQENPGVDINITVLDWGSAWTKITMAATAQNGPDLFQLPTTWAASLTEMGALLSLDSLLQEMGGGKQYVDAMMEYAYPRASDSVTSIPWFVDVRPAFYRKDVLRKMGMEASDIKNSKDFFNVLELIGEQDLQIEKKIIQPIGYPGKNDWNVIHNFAPWIWSAGGSFLNPNATRSRISHPATVRGIMDYLNMVKNGLNEKRNLEKNTAQVSADFDEGKLAFWLDASTKIVYLQRPSFLGGQGGRQSAAARNYGVMLPPTAPPGKDPKYFIGGSNLAIFKFSKHPYEAMRLMRYLGDRHNVQMKMARMSGFLPTLKSIYKSPYFTEDPNRKVFAEMIQHARPYPSVHYWGEIETSILIRRFGNIFDLLTQAGRGRWPEKQILTELKETDNEINRYIESQLQSKPGLEQKLKEYNRKRWSEK